MKNNVKKLLVVLLALLPCFQTSVMAGGFDDPDPEPIPIKENPSINPGGGPRSRARARYTEEVPACQYYNGEVTIMADSTITFISAQVLRVEDNVSWSGAAMDDTLVFGVSTDPGTYILTLTLSNGKSYYGEYILY